MMFISTQFAKLNLLYLSTKIMLQKIIIINGIFVTIYL